MCLPFKDDGERAGFMYLPLGGDCKGVEMILWHIVLPLLEFNLVMGTCAPGCSNTKVHSQGGFQAVPWS